MERMTEQHICQALAVHCIDFRFQRFLNEYLEKRFPGSYDRVAVAGGVKNLPLEQCEVSVKLHQPKSIVLFQHEDCGAYGGSKEFENLEAEKPFQKQEVGKAAAVLKEKFPDCAVEGYFVELSGNLTPVL